MRKYVTIAVTVLPETEDAMDEWLEQLNQGRAEPLKRSELFRAMVAWCVKNKPPVLEPKDTSLFATLKDDDKP